MTYAGGLRTETTADAPSASVHRITEVFQNVNKDEIIGSTGIYQNQNKIPGRSSLPGVHYCHQISAEDARRVTSWAPPSTMLTEDTRVSLAFFWSSGMVSAPQLHMVERIFDRVCRTLSESLPA